MADENSLFSDISIKNIGFVRHRLFHFQTVLLLTFHAVLLVRLKLRKRQLFHCLSIIP